MKSLNRIAVMLFLAGFASSAAAHLSEQDYNLFAGDFNGDARPDLLYIGKTSDKQSGIALADSNGIPQIGFQSWPATYLGFSWSTGDFIPAVGDFNGDGKSDILMQAATAGTSYVLLANTSTAQGSVGQILGINQSIAQTALGTQWSADQHKLLVGDFDGDGKDDVLLQAVNKGGTNAIILTDGSGNLFTRNGSAIGCSANGPQQCWTDGEQGLDWSTKSTVLTVGKFDSGNRADILYMPRPTIVLIDYEFAIPVPGYKPNSFGIFLSQMSSPSANVLGTADQLWSKWELGTQWSPPSQPASLSSSALYGTQVVLSWSASTGDFGTTGYLVERCEGVSCTSFVQIGASTTTMFVDTGRNLSTSYSYRVRAIDPANNLSAYSTTFTVSTAPTDYVAPTVPGGISAAATATTQISLSWSAATDNVGVTGYQVERCIGLACTSFAVIGTATTTGYSESGLVSATTYRYRVRAVDGAGNIGAYTGTIDATTWPSPGNSSYQYDSNGRLQSVTDYTGRVVLYSYDAAGNVIGIQVTP